MLGLGFIAWMIQLRLSNNGCHAQVSLQASVSFTKGRIRKKTGYSSKSLRQRTKRSSFRSCSYPRTYRTANLNNPRSKYPYILNGLFIRLNQELAWISLGPRANKLGYAEPITRIMCLELGCLVCDHISFSRLLCIE